EEHGLFERAVDLGDLRAGGSLGWYDADHHRVRLRPDSPGAARPGVCEQPRRVESPVQTDRKVPRAGGLSARRRAQQRARNLQDAAPLFAARGDATRLQIVARLCGEGPQSIVRLAHGAKVSRQAITKHLRALEKAGLARGSRAGRECTWELQTMRLSQ